MTHNKMPRLALIRRRMELGLKQEEVAQRAGISRSYYTKIEGGEPDPPVSVCERIAKALDTDLNIFLTETVPDRNEEVS